MDCIIEKKFTSVIPLRARLLFNFLFDLHGTKIYTMDDITKELISSGSPRLPLCFAFIVSFAISRDQARLLRNPPSYT